MNDVCRDCKHKYEMHGETYVGRGFCTQPIVKSFNNNPYDRDYTQVACTCRGFATFTPIRTTKSQA